MDIDRKIADKNIVCTCSDLYREDILESITRGCEEAAEVMYDHATQFRCDVCRPAIDIMIKRHRKSVEQQ